VDAWFYEYDNDEWEIEMPAVELAIALCLSQHSQQVALELLRRWMTPVTSTEDMEAFVQDDLPRL